MIARAIAMHFLRTLVLLGNLLPVLPAVAQRFPPLEGENLKGDHVSLPATGGAPHTLIALAYGHKAGPVLEEWFEPLYLRFVAKHGLFAQAMQVDVHFVPLFVGANKAAYEPTLKKFRKSAAPELLDRILFVRTELETVQEPLGLKDKDVPYFFIIDREGTIVHRSQGAYSDAKLEAMEEVLMQ
ncbi:MAG: hypothetical protein R2817_01350 [Flavobacteriales bacterium]